MASSGTYNFNLSNANVVQQAFSRIQFRRPQILAEHMLDAITEYNLLLASLSNLQPNLWSVELVSVPLIQGQAIYTVDPSVVMILDAYISFDGSTTSDRLIFPISRTEYASYPNKTAQGVSSVFWFDRLVDPSITLWYVPDATSTYTLNYYAVQQLQDANLPSGETPNVPYLWLDCLVAGMSHRMSRIYKPELETVRKADFDEAFKIAATQNVENVEMTISPGLDSYFR
jgi:hypothetical protein